MTRYKTLLVSCSLYLAACFCPALIFHVRHDLGAGGSVWGGYRSESGLSLLVMGLVWGWIRFNFTAFANVFLWLSWIAMLRASYPTARMLSAIALFLSLETVQLVFQPFLWDEGATQKGYLVSPHLGWFLWMASMGVIYRSRPYLRRQ